MNEMLREQADQALFDRIANRYARKDSVLSTSLARKNQLFSVLGPLLDELPTLGTILEIGCGVGAPARYLIGHYERYIGIDQSEEMVKAAIAFNQDNPRAEFVAASIKSEDLPQNVADVILSFGALHHMTELEDVLASLSRIAKPGAYLVVSEPQNGNPLIQLMRWIRGIVDLSYSEDQIFFSQDDLTELFQNHGITDLLARFEGFLTAPFAQVILQPQILSVPLCRAAIRVDAWLDTHLPERLKILSFNLAVIGRFRE
jgi:SAM-dependent methyltransferase